MDKDKYNELVRILITADDETLNRLFDAISPKGKANKSKEKEEIIAAAKETAAMAINKDNYTTDAVLAMIALATATSLPSIKVDELKSRMKQLKPTVESLIINGFAGLRKNLTWADIVDNLMENLSNLNKDD